MVVVSDDAPKGGVTAGGAIRTAGEKFPANVLPDGYFTLVSEGRVKYLSLEEGIEGDTNIGIPPIAVARNAEGEILYLPGDRKGFAGIQVEAAPREGRVLAAYAPTQGDLTAGLAAGLKESEILAGTEQAIALQTAAEAGGVESDYDARTRALELEALSTARDQAAAVDDSVLAEAEANARKRMAEDHGVTAEELGSDNPPSSSRRAKGRTGTETA